MTEAIVQARLPTGAVTGVASETEGGRAFLQDRLALLAKIWFIWSSAMLALSIGLRVTVVSCRILMMSGYDYLTEYLLLKA